MKSVNVNEVIKYFNDNYNIGISVDDFNEGSGVYSIFIGSRGEIDYVNKVDNFKLRSKEEIIRDNMVGNEDDKELLYYYDDFCNSGEIDWNELGGLYEGLNEEECIEYYNVVV